MSSTQAPVDRLAALRSPGLRVSRESVLTSLPTLRSSLASPLACPLALLLLAAAST